MFIILATGAYLEVKNFHGLHFSAWLEKLARKNTLAYYKHSYITTVKGFITLATEKNL
jgi:hypothetical protein